MGDESSRGGLLSWLGRSAANKLLTAVLVVAVVAALIWWFSLSPETRDHAIHAVKAGVLWTLIAAALPWGLFFVPPLVVRMNSNLASAVMLAAYCLVDMLVAIGLMGWQVSGRSAWAALLLGLLTSLVYNFSVSEYLATRAED